MKPHQIIRDPGFAKRLAQACDASPHCPEMHSGRLTWIQDQLSKGGMKISLETASRWMKGVARPRYDKTLIIAKVLNVDPVWLYHGVDSSLTVREVRSRQGEAEGVINVVAGFIQMDGGSPAFPAEDDERAKREYINLRAIIRGASYDFHVTTGQPVDDGFRFSLPHIPELPIVLGVVRNGFSIQVFEITDEMIAAHGKDKAIVLTQAQIDEAALVSFHNRLP